MNIKELKSALKEKFGMDFENGEKIENCTELFASFSISQEPESEQFPICVSLLVPKKTPMPLEILFFFQIESKDKTFIYDHLNEINSFTSLKAFSNQMDSGEYFIVLKYSTIMFEPYDISYILNTLEVAMNEFALEDTAKNVFELIETKNILAN